MLHVQVLQCILKTTSGFTYSVMLCKYVHKNITISTDKIVCDVVTSKMWTLL